MKESLDEYKEMAKKIYDETKSLSLTVKAIQQIRPQTHASSVKCWIDPEYAKRKNEQSKKATKKWKSDKPEAYNEMVKRRNKKVMERYHSDEEYRQKHLDESKNWRDEHPEEIKDYNERTKEARTIRRRKYEKRKFESDFEFKLLHYMRAFVRNKLKRHFQRKGTPYKKALTTNEYIGCNVEELAEHLRSLYKPGMTDENYGKEWHIDHIIPCAAFDLTDKEQAKQCLNIKNLQPLWAHENLAKRDKIM